VEPPKLPPKFEGVLAAHKTAHKALELAESHETTLDTHWRSIGEINDRVSALERRLGPTMMFERPASQHEIEVTAELAAKKAVEETGRHHIPLTVFTPSERVREIVANDRARSIVNLMVKILIPVLSGVLLLAVGYVIHDCQHTPVPAAAPSH